MSKPRVLFATSEVYPLVKTGGLADISYALAQSLRQLGVDARILIPGYTEIVHHKQLHLTVVRDNLNIFSSLNFPARLLEGIIPHTDIPVYVIDCPELYVRDGGPYQDSKGGDWLDNAMRFGVLSKVAALFGQYEYLSLFEPDIIHCNDWQAGLAPAFLHFGNQPHAKTLMNVHNLAHQGVFGPEVVTALNLPPESFSMFGLEYYGLMSFLKSGLYYSDWISTVSPTYAKEIQTPTFGYGLYDLLAHSEKRLTGILNGINVADWNPETDPYITANYSHANLNGKAQNTLALRKRCKLDNSRSSATRPIIGMITRLTHQKGFDLLIPVISKIIEEGAQLVLLGSGDKELEARLQAIAATMPESVSVTLGYDEEFSHQIEAGADIFLMPSRFEPCGLNQMYSMRYGTIPVVRRTGGLADTVVDTLPSTLDNRTATGFVFEEEDSKALLDCVLRALLVYRDKTVWKNLRINGMTRDFSWKNSAVQYITLYESLLNITA